MEIRLINDDCISALKDMDDESVDLIVTSPPYCMKKAYESPEDDVATFRQCHEEIFSDIYRVLKIGGSVC